MIVSFEEYSEILKEFEGTTWLSYSWQDAIYPHFSIKAREGRPDEEYALGPHHFTEKTPTTSWVLAENTILLH